MSSHHKIYSKVIITFTGRCDKIIIIVVVVVVVVVVIVVKRNLH